MRSRKLGLRRSNLQGILIVSQLNSTGSRAQTKNSWALGCTVSTLSEPGALSPVLQGTSDVAGFFFRCVEWTAPPVMSEAVSEQHTIEKSQLPPS